MSMEDLASILDVTPGAISLIELGKRSTSSYTIFKLSKEFNIPIDAFYYGDESTSSSSDDRVG